MEKIYNEYGRGSEWRKWDLHLHTPYTNLNSYKASDEDFIKKLKDEKIQVVAITNYFQFKNEEFNLKRKLEKEGITTFLNLEMRLSYTNAKQDCCDIHVIFSDDVTKDQLDKFLVKLNLNVGASKQMAIDLQPSEFTDATVEFEHLYTTLNEPSLKLKGRFFIGFLSRGKGNARSSKSYEQVENKSHFVIHSSDEQSNLDDDREFWLSYGKPLFQSSDAHKLDVIGTKFSWIKSDPTFEGLKQVIYEPEERIRLQQNKPDDKADYQVLESLELNDPSTWSGKIELNENLNTIIGGRSTGKSSLLASIAFKLNKFETNNEILKSHIEKSASSLILNWKDHKADLERDIDYFPQNYMYSIAYDTNKRNSLVKSIISKKDTNNVLEQYNRFGSERKLALESVISNLFSEKQELNLLKVELASLGDKVGIQTEIKKLESELNNFNTVMSNADRTQYESQSARENELQALITRCVTVLNELSALKEYSFFKEIDFSTAISHKALRAELTEKRDVLKGEFDRNWSKFISDKELSVRSKIADFSAELAIINKDPIYIKGQELISQNKAATILSSKLRSEQEKLLRIESKTEVLEKKLEYIDSIVDVISVHHKEFKSKAEALSATLKFVESDLEVTVACSFDHERIFSILSEQLMQRSKEQKQLALDFCTNYAQDPQNTVDSLLKLALEEKIECKGSHTPQSVLTQVLSSNTYRQDYELTYQNDNFQQMSQGKQSFVILKLLLEFSDKTCPILIDQPEDSLDNRAIYNELVAYLKKKKRDRQIILVTHNPNVVVSADAEQIIVANQNDVKAQNEFGSKFQYVSGGIEHSKPKNTKESIFLYSQGIREHICEVLEGGDEAFRKREQKYQLVQA